MKRLDANVVRRLSHWNFATARRVAHVGFAIAVAIPAVALGHATDDRLGLPLSTRAACAATDPNAVLLGRKLFFDKRLSADGAVSCASCHQPEHAFTDGLPKSRGVRGLTGTRNAPSLLNAALVQSQFWDGREPSLEDQAPEPLVNPVEHGLDNLDSLLAIIRSDAAYVRDFAAVYGVSARSINARHVARALASFERSLAAGNSAFDRYYYGGDSTALSPEAVRGLLLFTGRAQCSTCHTIGPHGAALTDDQFHTLHVGMSHIEGRLSELTQRVFTSRKRGESTAAIVLGNDDIAQLGRFVVTLAPGDIGKFRTPSLRNVALTAPYMHDGSVATLREAVEQEVYYRTAESGRPLILTPREKDDLISFLTSLTSSRAKMTHPP